QNADGIEQECRRNEVGEEAIRFGIEYREDTTYAGLTYGFMIHCPIPGMKTIAFQDHQHATNAEHEEGEVHNTPEDLVGYPQEIHGSEITPYIAQHGLAHIDGVEAGRRVNRGIQKGRNEHAGFGRVVFAVGVETFCQAVAQKDIVLPLSCSGGEEVVASVGEH